MKWFVDKLLTSLIFINILLALWLPLHGDLGFWPDNARDLLILEDIVKNKHVILIGPHSGLPGVFHGPLWPYINIPAYLIGHGDPGVISFFFVVLYALATYIVYVVAKKFFGKTVGLLSALLYSAIFTGEASGFGNTYGAVLLFPLFFYWFVLYLQSKNVRLLLASLFTLGLIIQFQIAFGGPVLLLTALYLIYFTYKNKKVSHLFSSLILLVPLSTYILFELKHNFLQLRSVIGYFQRKGSTFINLTFISERFSLMINDGFGTITRGQWWLSAIFLIAMVYLYIKTKKDTEIHKRFYYMTAYYYIGYWLITLLYKGQLWVFYHWSFIPILIMVFISLYKWIDKRLFIIIFLLFYFFTMYQQLQVLKNLATNYIGKSPISWIFFKNTISSVYRDAPGEFGYFIYSDDQMGNRGHYAFHYLQPFFSKKHGYSNKKKSVTYILVSSTNKPDWWLKNVVKINRKPDHEIIFKNGFRLQKYLFTPQEVAIPSDPNLVDILFFR